MLTVSRPDLCGRQTALCHLLASLAQLRRASSRIAQMNYGPLRQAAVFQPARYKESTGIFLTVHRLSLTRGMLMVRTPSTNTAFIREVSTGNGISTVL